jgi:hypothetical protein
LSSLFKDFMDLKTLINLGKFNQLVSLFSCYLAVVNHGWMLQVHLIVRFKNPVDGSIEEKHLADAPRPLGDFGPVLARVEVLDVADIDNPNRTVRQAKARVHWQVMRLDAQQYDAAERMLDLLEQAGGACWRPDGMRVRRPAHEQGHPSERQLFACEALAQGKEAAGQDGYYLAEMVIGDQVTLDEMGGARMHATVSGCGDNLATDDEDAIHQARAYLTYLPTRWTESSSRPITTPSALPTPASRPAPGRSSSPASPT